MTSSLFTNSYWHVSIIQNNTVVPKLDAWINYYKRKREKPIKKQSRTCEMNLVVQNRKQRAKKGRKIIKKNKTAMLREICITRKHNECASTNYVLLSILTSFANLS